MARPTSIPPDRVERLAGRPPPAGADASPLLAVLFVLIAAIVAVIAFGVTLILQRDQPTSATPPRVTTEPPRPATASPHAD